jgi:hypothetical protein
MSWTSLLPELATNVPLDNAYVTTSNDWANGVGGVARVLVLTK